MIALFSLLFGLMNAIAGRGIIPKDRLIFRCILPGIVAGIYTDSWYVWFATTTGSALWYPWGWSFDEINGTYDPNKYPRWIQRIGLHFVPINGNNKLRGIIIKGIRGGFDILTFCLLANPLYPFTLLMGAVYWVSGKIVPTSYAVMMGEFLWGCIRGFIIMKGIFFYG